MKRSILGALGASVLAAAASVFTVGCESSDSYEISVSPNYAKLRPGQSVTLVADGWGDYKWSVSPAEGGHLSRTTGGSVVFTAESGASSNATFTVTAVAVGSGETSSSSTNSASSGGYSATAKIAIQ